MIDFDELRKQVAIKHNVLIGKDDPILVTVTVNDIVLSHYLDKISNQYEEANRALMSHLQQQVEYSKEIAGQVITDASNYISVQVQQAATAILNEMKNDLQRQTTKAQAISHEARVSNREAQTAKSSAYLAAVLAGIAAVITVAALFVILAK
ncbi:MAG: conjugal transfer protein TraM [Gammaproteobacteria bacterium]